MPGRPCTWAGVRDSTGLLGLLGVSQGQWAPRPLWGLSGSVGSPALLGFSGSVGPPTLLGVSKGQSVPPTLLRVSKGQWAPPGHSWGLSGLVRALRLFTPKVILKFKEIQNTGQELSLYLDLSLLSKALPVSVINGIGQHHRQPLKTVCLPSAQPP